MSMKLKERLTSLPLFILFALAFYYSRKFPKVPKLLPTALSVLGMFLTACIFARSFLGQEKQTAAADKAGMFRVTAAIVLVLAYVLSLQTIGFYTTSFLFIMVFACLIDTKKYSWWLYPAVAGGMLGLIYLVFDLFLHVLLPKGILF